MYLIWLIETNPKIPIGEKFINFYIVVHLVQEKCDKLFLITNFLVSVQESVRLMLREVSFYDQNQLRLFIILSKGKNNN